MPDESLSGLASQPECAGVSGTAASQSWKGFDLLAWIILAVINVICFAGVLNCYFLADDFLHISFLYKTLSTHPELLLLKLNAPWQDPSIHLFVRPLTELSLALDYLLWKTNAFGFHITNLVLQIASSICVYGITMRILRGFPRRQAFTAALMSGALFAASPLHGEVVAWVIGRTDGLCGMFYLLSLWLFMRHFQDRRRGCPAASLLCFAISMLSKEMAISLPVVAGLFAFLFCDARGLSLPVRFVQAWRASAAYLVVVAGYLAVRFALIGTVVGGYVGSLGSSMTEHWWFRMQPACFMPLLYPMNTAVLHPHGRISLALHCLYLLIGALILLRAIKQPWAPQLLKNLAFVAGFFILSALPVVQSWYITQQLTGSRYAYIPSAPLYMLLALIAYPLYPKESGGTPDRRLSLAAAGLLTAFVCLFTVIAIRHNEVWMAASREMLAMQQEIVNRASQRNGGRKIVILNLPLQAKGAHLFYNFDEFKQLLTPPVCKSDLTGNLAALETREYSNRDLLNMSRLREIERRGDCETLLWNESSRRIEPVSVEQRAAWNGDEAREAPALRLVSAGRIHEDDVEEERSTYSVEQPSFAPACGFLEVTAVAPEHNLLLGLTAPTSILSLTWEPDRSELFGPAVRVLQELSQDGKPHTYVLAVGEHKSWCFAGKIDRIHISFPQASIGARVLSARLLKPRPLVPELRADPLMCKDRGDGMHVVNGGAAVLTCDASHVEGAAGVLAEVSRNYNEFEHYTGTFRDCSPSPHAMARLRFGSLKATVRLPVSLFPSPGWYQVRVAGIRPDGSIAGYFSDPVFLSIQDQ